MTAMSLRKPTTGVKSGIKSIGDREYKSATKRVFESAT